MFFNRVNSPCQGVVLAVPRRIELRLDRLSVDVAAVVVAVADGGTSAGRACFNGGIVSVRSDEGFDAIHQLGGLTSGRCVVLVEVYRSGERWKLRAVSRGWSDGVSAFVESYGIEVDSDADTRVDGGQAGSVAVSMIVVPDQFAGDPIGSGEAAWRKKRAGESLNEFEELHAVEYEAGLVRGTHFLKWGEEVARLKREGRLVEALEMLLEVIAATEREQAREYANAPVRAAHSAGRSRRSWSVRRRRAGHTMQRSSTGSSATCVGKSPLSIGGWRIRGTHRNGLAQRMRSSLHDGKRRSSCCRRVLGDGPSIGGAAWERVTCAQVPMLGCFAGVCTDMIFCESRWIRVEQSVFERAASVSLLGSNGCGST